MCLVGVDKSDSAKHHIANELPVDHESAGTQGAGAQGGDATEHRCNDGSMGSRAGCEVGFGQYSEDLWPVQEPDVLIVASEGRVPHRSQERGLVAIRPVDSFNRHTRGVGDLGDRGPSVAWADEQIVRRPNDPLPRINRGSQVRILSLAPKSNSIPR